MNGDPPEAVADPYAACLLAAAARLGVPARHEPRCRPSGDSPPGRWLRLDVAGRPFYHCDGVLRHGMDGETLGPDINGEAPAITASVLHTKEFLAIRGVPVPAGALFVPSEGKKALAFFRAMARPMRIRPNRRSHGAPIGARVEDTTAFAPAFDTVGLRSSEILVEECAEGDVVRYLYVSPGVAAAMLAGPASAGDGDAACADGTHPSYAAVAEAACRAVPELVVASVDMAITDRRRPAARGNHWVLEIDGAPAIHDFAPTRAGGGQDVGGAMVQFLMRGGRE